MDGAVNIAGVLVHARPSDREAVRQSLAELPGVAVHAATEDGRLIITVEDEGDTCAADTLLAVDKVHGVLSAALVYHHFECVAPET